MQFLKHQAIFETMDQYGKDKIPFLFVVDFKKENGLICPLSEINSQEIKFEIGSENTSQNAQEIELKIFPENIDDYQKKFNKVFEAILRGNSYLTNLTCETRVETSASLEDLFDVSNAHYKLWVKDHFTCFSPETFVKIKASKIFAFPMKGTIDAKLPNAEETLLNSPKETAEHYTIVDLIRNDLSMIATDVKVERFKYLEKIKAKDKEILQMSSEISGNLPPNFSDHLGQIFDTILPAGSICGAPKRETLALIDLAENYNRNFYSGVFGVFDGNDLDSAVMIRFIEKNEKGLFYKSGGGITFQSQVKEEYEEILQKIYVPIH